MNNFEALIVNADAGRIPLLDGVVHCTVTSSPYWNLRAYEGQQCRHWPAVSYAPMPGLAALHIPAWYGALGAEDTPEAFIGHLVACFREVKRVLREDGVFWCVIGDSFTSMLRSGRSASPKAGISQETPPQELSVKWGNNRHSNFAWKLSNGLQPGDLIGIPFMLWKALQADGWIVRNECVWHKVAPMPESVAGVRWERHRVKVGSKRPQNQPGRSRAATVPGRDKPSGQKRDAIGGVFLGGVTWADCPGCAKCARHGGYVLRRGSWRHTRSHESVLMCVKSMGYFADQERVREGIKESSIERYNYGLNSRHSGFASDSRTGSSYERLRQGDGVMGDYFHNPAGRNPRDVLKDDTPVNFMDWLAREYGQDVADEMMGRLLTQMSNSGDTLSPSPESYAGAHYATFPRSLIAPLIQASCPTRCCPACGSGWAPVVEREVDNSGYPNGPGGKKARDPRGNGASDKSTLATVARYSCDILGYRPTCDCRVSTAGVKAAFGLTDPALPDEVVPPSVPGLLLDPFIGSGTTALVAKELGLRCIGLDLSAEYLDGQASVRVLGHTPAGVLDGLPLFAELDNA